MISPRAILHCMILGFSMKFLYWGKLHIYQYETSDCDTMIIVEQTSFFLYTKHNIVVVGVMVYQFHLVRPYVCLSISPSVDGFESAL